MENYGNTMMKIMEDSMNEFLRLNPSVKEDLTKLMTKYESDNIGDVLLKANDSERFKLKPLLDHVVKLTTELLHVLDIK